MRGSCFTLMHFCSPFTLCAFGPSPAVLLSHTISALTDPPAAHEQSLRSLSSEHAMIAKEQTAKAIANAANVYEKNGVEAALCEVRTQPREQPAAVCVLFFSNKPWLFSFLCDSVAVPHLSQPPSAFVFLILFLLLLGHSQRR